MKWFEYIITHKHVPLILIQWLIILKKIFIGSENITLNGPRSSPLILNSGKYKKRVGFKRLSSKSL